MINYSIKQQQVNSLPSVANKLSGYIVTVISKPILTPITNDILNAIDMCRTVSPYLIIMVPSAPGHIKQRQAIRDTYARLSRDRVSNVYGWQVRHIVRVMFVLGKGTDYIDERVKGENIEHNDILQFDFKDSYYNLTRKMLNGFKWISTHCENVTYVLKANDDVFVNTIALLIQLKKHPIPDVGAVFGFIYHGTRLWRFGKWAISADIHPEKILPEYVSGTAYTLTANVLPKIVQEAELLPYIQAEDTYITGIIASVRLGASLVSLPGSPHLNEDRIDPCSFVELGRVAQSNLYTHDQYAFWKALTSYETECMLLKVTAKKQRKYTANV